MSLSSFKRFFLISSLLLILFLMSGCTFYQYIAHYANQYGWRTKLTIQNGNSTDVNVTINCYDNQGTKISTATLTIPGYSFKTDYVDNFFTDTIPETGSLEVVSDEDGIVSKISTITLFEHSDSKGQICMAGLQGTPTPSKYLSFPWFENSSNFTTGIAILNVSGHDIVATMRAFKGDGTYVYSNPIKLAPYERIIGFASDFFDEDIPDMSTLDVYGTGKMAGFIIMYNGDQTKAEAINGVVTKNEYTSLITFENYYNGENVSNDNSFVKISRDYNKVYVLASNEGIYEFDKNNLDSGNLIFNPSSVTFYGEFDISPDGKKVVAEDSCSGNIYEIDLTGHHASKVIDNLNGVAAVAFSNDGNYFAVGSNLGTIVLYDYDVLEDTYTPAKYFNISGGFISNIKFSPDSKYLLACDWNLGKLYYVDLSTGSFDLQTKDINLNGPESIEFSPDGKIYICGDEKKICLLNDLSSNPSYITFSSVPGLWRIAFSSDGRYLFGTASNGSSKILIIDTYNITERTIDVGYQVTDVTFSDEGHYLYYSGEHIGTLY